MHLSTNNDAVCYCLPLFIVYCLLFTVYCLLRSGVINSALIDYFVNELEIINHFKLIKHFILLEDGAFTETLTDPLFQQVK